MSFNKIEHYFFFIRQQGHIDDAAALHALQDHAKEQCCWGTGAANNSRITRTVHRSFLHVKIEFCSVIYCTQQSVV